MNTKSLKSNALVKVERIHHCIGAKHQKGKCFHLGPLSLDIRDGEIMVVLGPSGSGKTALLRSIAGLSVPKEGQLSIDSKVMVDHNTFVQPEKRSVGMVFQDHALFPHLTVRGNILFGISDWSKKDQMIRLKELEELVELGDQLEKYPHELSGGQQQRVALARTLAQKPKLILLACDHNLYL